MSETLTLPPSPAPLDRLLKIGWVPGELAEAAAFASPQPVLDLVRRLCFRRVRGASLGPGAPSGTLPFEIPAALASAQAPFGFLAANRFGEAVVAVGTSGQHEAELVSGLRALVGGPEPEPLQLGGLLEGTNAATCLVGLPPSEGESRPEALRSAADLLFDALGDAPFALLVFAAPEPEVRLARLLQELREGAEALDRTYLQLERQANVDRAALRARDLLDRAAAHVQQGAVQPLWRASVLALARDPATAQRVASLWATAINAASSERTIPLQVFSCAPSSAGRPPHLNLFTSQQMARLCPLPARDRAGFARIWSCTFDVDHPQHPNDLALGEIVDRHRPSGRWFGIAPEVLSRHTLVAGHTGAGKTTTVQRLLATLADREVPFLVLEPAKHEYAALRSAVPGLRAFGVTATGRLGHEPLYLNPLAFPAGFPLHTHLDLVRSALTASYGLVPPAPYLLEQALYEAYERRGWDLVSGAHPLAGDELAFPTLSDLVASVELVVARAGYDGELTRNLRSALLTRLGSLCRGPKGVCFDTPASLLDTELLDRPVIVNLSELGSDEEKALVMGLLLVRLFEVRSLAAPTSPLQHLLVVEEAHRLLRRTAERAVDDGNMAHQAVQTFVHLLAEMRAYGQGFLAVEQLPTKLAPEVVKLAGTKIVHRLLPEDDRQLVGSTMGLSEDQRRMLGLLEVGEAAAHSEGMDSAVRLRVPHDDCESKEQLRDAISEAPPRPETLLGWWRTRSASASRLGLPEVRRSADGVLTVGLMDGAVGDALAILRSAVEDGISPSNREGSKRLMHTALEEALLRRATFYGWGSACWSDLRQALKRGPREAARKMRELLATDPRRHASCASPAQNPCSWGYEAERLAKDPRLLSDLEEAFLAPADAMASELGSAFREACDRVFQAPDVARSPELRRCAAGVVLSQWALSRTTRDLLLDKVREAKA